VPRRAALLALVPVLLLAGCTGARGSAPASSGETVRVVASTDVWGDIVQRLGGPQVQVDSIITDPSRDPHEYQSDPRDQLAVSRAAVVLLNGGGYDDFLQRMTAAAQEGTRVIDAADASGLDEPAGGEFNEHLWYSFAAVEKVAVAVSAALVEADPSHRAAFGKRLAAFRAELQGLEQQEAAIRALAEGKGVAITEPVPLYLTRALGLVNRTPAAFSEATEAGNDVAPSVLLQQLDLLRQHRVAVLAYNEQTEGATTDQVLAAAKQAGVPAVGFRETLPQGQGYVEWMRADLAEMKGAVAG
jgi:zinc/manganese transport system substrate-binding protein